jgi:hypothetical protein
VLVGRPQEAEVIVWGVAGVAIAKAPEELGHIWRAAPGELRQETGQSCLGFTRELGAIGGNPKGNCLKAGGAQNPWVAKGFLSADVPPAPPRAGVRKGPGPRRVVVERFAKDLDNPRDLLEGGRSDLNHGDCRVGGTLTPALCALCGMSRWRLANARASGAGAMPSAQ